MAFGLAAVLTTALREVRTRCLTEGIGWIVDADVSGYFDRVVFQMS